MDKTLKSQIISDFLYKILILIETIQLIWYSIHPRLTFLWDTAFGTYITDLIKYFQVYIYYLKIKHNLLSLMHF